MEIYFTEFLLQKGYVGEEGLLTALMTASSRAPSLFEVAAKLRLVSTKDLIEVFNIQSKRRIDFISACKAHGVWNDSFETLLYNEVLQNQSPISQVLVEKGAITYANLNRALDEYLSKAKESSEPQDVSGGSVSPAVLAEVKDAFSEKRKTALMDLAYHISQTTEHGSAREAFEGFLTNIHELKGICRLTGAAQAEALIAKAESMITQAIEKSDCLDARSFQSLGGCLTKIILCLWNSSDFFFCNRLQRETAEFLRMSGSRESGRALYGSPQRDFLNAEETRGSLNVEYLNC